MVYKSLQSPLKYQTRCIACFPDKTGYLLGSIEGRVAVHHVEDNLQNKNFTFKCHRWAGAHPGGGKRGRPGRPRASDSSA